MAWEERGVTLEEIDRQRALGWPDFHPEDYCHRCGRLNTRSWFAGKELWEQAEIAGRWNEIICPPCFTELWEQATDSKATFEICLAFTVNKSPSTITVHHRQGATA